MVLLGVLFGTIVNVPQGVLEATLSRDQLAHPSSRIPYDNKSFIVRPCHPVVEESVRFLQAEYKTLQQFYHCSAQSNVRTKSAQHLHEDSLRSNNTYVHLRKSESRDGQCGSQGIGRLLLIEGNSTLTKAGLVRLCWRSVSMDPLVDSWLSGAIHRVRRPCLPPKPFAWLGELPG